MSWSKIIACSMAGLILTACGGGGGGTGAAPASPAPTPGVFSRKAATVGDFTTYKSVQTIQYGDTKPGTVSAYYTKYVSEQNGNLHNEMTQFSGADITASTDTYDQDGKKTKNVKPGSCTTEYLPSFPDGLPATVRIDTVWDNSITASYSCFSTGAKGSYQFSTKGKVLGQETITVAAGTFSTIKYSVTSTTVQTTSTTVTENTCWADPDSGVDVKCDAVRTFTSTAAPQSNNTRTTTDELLYYAHAATQRKKLGTERFAGDWAGVYSGADHGYCTFTVELSGQLHGSCQSNGLGGTFALSGAIDASGNLSFILSANGVTTPTFQGTLDSPGYMAGTWLLSTGGGGSWYMQHQ
ncbi:hypothetical protein GJ699_29880 [Duganella sp. FT80W]|uniref:Lipoprotein n=1 Tax=Duganella guangzhouensis TaxID=2666084 RepID=A0A6I2L7M7_9BURK|nr:hypothetical protein [Duganella guangzhouensis]MRW94191.1 hypothetical protein [Duganella guangzhouensis]